MRPIFSFLLLWLLPAAIFAQAGYAVSGRMVDGMTGKPLARATVSLALLTPGVQARSRSSGAFTTSSDGAFIFRGLAPGTYQLSASRRGYLPSMYLEHDGFFAGVVVGPGKAEMRGMRFGLLPYGVVRGTVADSSGDPVESGTVNLYRRATDGSGRIRLQHTEGLRAGHSEYEFADLPPGNYWLAVDAKPWFAKPAEPGKARGSLDLSYPMTYFDASLNEAEAQAIPVRAGEIVTANFNLRAVPSVHLSIRIEAQTATNQVTYFPSLSASPFGEPFFLQSGSTTTQPEDDGKQEMIFSVAPGSYRVHDGDFAVSVDASSDVTLEANPTLPTVAVAGKVAMANGQPLPPKLTFQLLRLQDGQSSFASGLGTVEGDQTSSAILREDGGFALKVAQDGNYSLVLQGAERYTVVGAAASGGEISGNVLHIGRKPVTLAATLAPSGSSVSGFVSSGKAMPEAGVTVLLIPEDAAAEHLYREDETNTDGSWEVEEVAAGRYRVLAIRDGWDLAWRTPAVLEKYLRAGGTPVVVDGRSPLKLDAPLRVQAR